MDITKWEDTWGTINWKKEQKVLIWFRMLQRKRNSILHCPILLALAEQTVV